MHDRTISVLLIKRVSHLSQAHPIGFEHVYDFEIQVSPHALLAQHHLQQLAVSVMDSSKEPLQTASSACVGNVADDPNKDFKVEISFGSAVSPHLTLMLAQLVA